jgi:hypothetical protein
MPQPGITPWHESRTQTSKPSGAPPAALSPGVPSGPAQSALGESLTAEQSPLNHDQMLSSTAAFGFVNWLSIRHLRCITNLSLGGRLPMSQV